jgi:hypothetical protein
MRCAGDYRKTIAPGMLDDAPIVRAAFARTVRLVSTARLRASVLRPLVDDDDELAALAELEGATSARLTGQSRGTPGVSKGEFIFGVPHPAFINASFAYAKPCEPNRFNGTDRGAWYCALEAETCIREVGFHMTQFLEAAGDLNAVVEYAEMFASLAGEFVDLRQIDPAPQCLHPNKEIGYSAGNALADAARSEGLNGIIYPSVRHAGGTCIVALRPHAVQSVAQEEAYRMIWAGERAPRVEKLLLRA